MFSKKKIVAAVALCCLLWSGGSADAAVKDFDVHINGEGVVAQPTAQDDFYMYVNYKWMKDTPLPKEEFRYGSFNIVADKTREQLSTITADAIADRTNKNHASDAARIADMHACIMDTAGREAAGLGNLAKPLQMIEKVNTLQEYTDTMALLAKEYGISVLIGGYSVSNEPRTNDRYVVYLNEPNIGLGKEFLSQPSNEKYFKYYRDHVRDILMLYGRPEAAAVKAANDIFVLQQDLASHAMTIAELYNPSKSIHQLDLQGVGELYKHTDYNRMLSLAGISPADGVHAWYVRDPGLIGRFDELFTADRLPLFKEYAIYSLLSGYSTELTPAYAQSSYEYQMKMSDVQQAKTAERRAEESNEELLAIPYGRLYAQRYCSAATRDEVKSYINDIMAVYKKKLTNLDWMEPATKVQALKKLDTMVIKIGYPDKWLPYMDNFVVVRPEAGGCLINNVLAVEQAGWNYMKSRIGQDVDRSEWSMYPQTINACYEFSNNDITFPAAMLQAPFFATTADRATNLGGIGMVIAHEITHSFDSNGAQYDENGCFNNWWTAKDKQEFKARQQSIINFYDRYTFGQGLRENGTQTLSENIADLGAMACLTDIIGDNINDLQKVYTSYANIWKQKETDGFLRIMLTDVHSVSYVRVDAVLSSTDGFYRAFNVKETDGMYVAPEDRARLW